MGSPAIFNGKFTKLLTSRGVLTSAGRTIDYNGVQNFIANGHAEVDTTGWAAYADAAASTPADGTGGSPTVTVTRSTSSPLRDTASFVLTKDAANRQGEGVSYAFTVDSADASRNVSVSFDYSTSGTFTAGDASDVRVYLYDVTNAAVIYPNGLYGETIKAGSGRYAANFALSSSTSYRLVLHCATTSASAYDLKFDNVKVSPVEVVQGAVQSDWQTYTLTIGASSGTSPTLGTISRNEARWRRVGGDMEIQYSIVQTSAGTAGSGAGAAYLFPLPSGYQIDSTRLTVDSTNFATVVGPAVTYASAGTTTADAVSVVVAYNSTNLAIRQNGGAGTMTTVGPSAADLGNAKVEYGFTARVPILGWSSNMTIASSSTFNISNVLANGTRVTAAPTALGQYRSRYKSAVTSNTFSDVAPTTTPTAADGLRLHAANYASAQTSGQISLYDIFIGKNKHFVPRVYSAAAKTGQVFYEYGIESSTVTNGTRFTYDQSTGVLTVEAGLNITSNTSRGIGVNTSATQVTDGYFDVVVSENALAVGAQSPRSEVFLTGKNGYGSTNTKIIRFATQQTTTNNGDITYVDSATDGASFTINSAGVYAATLVYAANAAGTNAGISKNSNQLTTNINTITAAHRLACEYVNISNDGTTISATFYASVGDVIRPHSNGASMSAVNDYSSFRLVKVSD